MVPAGRPREFDMDRVLEKAMEAFWSHGYEATSMADLMEATGLHKGSIYKAFESKHGLFIAALDRYLDQLFTQLRDTVSGADTPREGLLAWLRMAESWGTDRELKGCFALNTVVEMGPHDPEIQQRLQRHMARTTKFLAEVASEGQALGEFRTDIPPEGIARYLGTLAAGIVTTARGGFPDPEVSPLPELALAALS